LAIFDHPLLGGLTVSAGLAAAKGSAAMLDSLMAQADAALLDAKRRGRNCSVAAEQPRPDQDEEAATSRSAIG
jgi:GGDEF domain-containing protein